MEAVLYGSLVHTRRKKKLRLDEGMTNGSPIFAYLVFGLGRVSFERLSRPNKAMV
jgi:hypothetical protein